MSYYINVIEIGLWSCGLILRTLKSWHFSDNFCKICIFGDGNSDDHMFYRDLFLLFLWGNYIFQLKINIEIKIIVIKNVISKMWIKKVYCSYSDSRDFV